MTSYRFFASRLAAAILLGSGTFVADAPAQEILRNDDRAVIPLGTIEGREFGRLVIRNAIIVSGRGTPGTGRATPPEGPVDILIEDGRIADIMPVDAVSLGNTDAGRLSGDAIIDADGRYVLPGLFDLHAHVPPDGGRAGDRGLEYAFRLWLGHGVTTLRDPGTGAGLPVMTEMRRLSEENRIVAPRLRLYKRWPRGPRAGSDQGHTPEEARALVRQYYEQGADGIKVSKGPGHYPDVLRALTDEATRLGMGVAVDLKVGETDAVVASNAGVTSIEHWYGIPDAALVGTQSFPPDYNYYDELDRFRYAGYLWKEAAQYPDRLSAVLDLMIENGTAWNPTFGVYEANRDFMRAVTLPWRERFAHPELLEYWEPNPAVHASYHSEWKTSDEVAWHENFDIWKSYLYEFWKRGGLVGLGSDAGSLQALYGFTTIRELELLQEAGIHPLDVVKIATTNSARILGLEEQLCGIRIGCTADLIVVDGNPIDNFKVLYGAGLGFYGTGDQDRGGVLWTIKAGVVFDAPALLREVEWYVQEANRARQVTQR